MMRQFIIDIIEEPWLFIESLIGGALVFGSFYLFVLFATAIYG